MRQQLANLFWLSALSGCSLIYNPNNLDDPKADAAIDARPIDAPFIDADPNNLGIESVAPAELLEGQGDGGSQPAVLVVLGHDILGTATIDLTSSNPDVHIMTMGAPVIGRDAKWIATLVKVDVSETVDTGTTEITATVRQNSGSAVMGTATFVVKNLKQLEAADIVDGKLPAVLETEYSRVDLTGATVTGPLLPGGTGAVLIRSVTSINIPFDIDASAPFTRDNTASRQTPGPGGAGGGARGAAGGGRGGGKSTTTVGKGGGGGGFAAAGEAGEAGGAGGDANGDAFIADYETNTSGGGAGGTDGGGLSAPLPGGLGGGSGGVVELTAGASLTVGAITAVGADGGMGTETGIVATAGGGGGGGAGGLVLLRSGGTLTVGAVSVAGGAKGAGGINNGGILGTAGTPGGNGAAGRVRFDSPDAAAAVPGATRGFYIVPPSMRIFEEETPTFTVRGETNTQYYFRVLDGTADATPSPMQTLGSTTGTFKPTIGLGFNRVCVVVIGGDTDDPEAANCITVVGLPTSG